MEKIFSFFPPHLVIKDLNGLIAALVQVTHEDDGIEFVWESQ